MHASSEAAHLGLIVVLKHSRWIFLAGAMMALTACSSLGLDNDEPEADKDAVNPIRQALASGGSVADADRAIEQKDYQRAYDILRPYLVLNPGDDAAKISLAQTYLGRYEGRNAQTILDSLSEDAKDGPKVHMIRGLLIERLSRATDRIATMDEHRTRGDVQSS